MNTDPAPVWLVKAASVWHRLMAALSPLAWLYLQVVTLVAPLLSTKRRQQLLNSLSTTSWPAASLCARRVKLGAKGPVIRFTPHEREFDFAAVLRGTLDYEREVFDFLEGRLSSYDVVVEIGANVGVFTCMFGEKLRNTATKIYAFEPAPKAYGRLVENLRLNGLEQVNAFNAAVGSETSFQMFFEPQGCLTNGSLLAGFAGKFSEAVRSRPVLVVDAAMLRFLLDGCRHMLLKIDVEGYEANVLESLAPVLASHRPDILLEVLPEYAAGIEAALAKSLVAYSYHAITPEGLLRQDGLRAVHGRDCFICPVKESKS
ncbi:FkbM family methyltransferase [Brevifollis gellanilyticus]|uniref:Methyltransferase FkbM domain-containing protein n=1 Tax=Brevifollis gellanilyticus TaxID=748831 RepID=A0A512M9X9_9BACT|nr:FkbM family methyltransferase [Brevifollis gellanilyticus]GEP43532.1 hypothetical protein BGE01nite_28230 [Brevifollis gellanilyticus]